MSVYNEAGRQFFKLMEQKKYEWWPTEGTLIGLLRWGSNFGKVDAGIIVTDTDIDVMIRVKDGDDWNRIKQEIEEELKKSPLWTSFKTHPVPGMKTDRSKFTAYTNTKFDSCRDGNIHVDIHSYMVDEEENIAYVNPKCKKEGFCKGVYPFQVWQGVAPYRGLIVDEDGKFGKVKFNEMSLPCPHRYLELLGKWNNHEYGSDESALGMPIGGCTLRRGKWRSVDYSLSHSDRDRVHNSTEALKEKGYKSFDIPDTDEGMDEKMLTIITAYFDLDGQSKKGGKGSSKYRAWMMSLLSYSGPMIIFADDKTRKYLELLRIGLPTVIVTQNIEELRCNRYRGNFHIDKAGWAKQKGDNETQAVIWNEKLEWVKRGIELSPFNTEYYAWYDIGYVRSGKTLPLTWPNEKKLIACGDKVQLLTFSSDETICNKPYHPGGKMTYDNPPHGVMITGGFILGKPKELLEFHNLFYNTLEELISLGEYVGNDQYVMSACYCKRPLLFNLIRAKKHPFVDDKEWFYGIPYFAPYFENIVAKRKIGCKEVPLTFTYINLEERPDRRQEVETEFADVSNVKIERFNAILHTNRPLGCTLSHIKVLEEIIARDDLYGVIIEDDFEFTMVPEVAMSRLYAALEELEKLGAWDVLMLSASTYGLNKEDFSQDISRVVSAQTAGAYIVSRRYCETLLDNFKEGAQLLQDNPSKSKHFAVDQYWKRLQEHGHWYIMEPIIVKQRPSLSSISDTFVDYEF
jgi:hypothetical protein